MDAFVINTGSELLLGDVLNTHLQFIAREIFALGAHVTQQVTVPDGPAIRDALEDALAQAELVFVTGGLGPTTDDITRETAAELLGIELSEDPETAAAITLRLRTRGFPMTDRILRQAQVPAGATVLPNANGTAPGLYLPAANIASGRRAHLFLLPGPPRELHPMFRESVLPILHSIVPARSTISRTFRLTSIGESVVEAAVGEQLLALPQMELGYCAHAGSVDVRVIGPAETVRAAEAVLTAAFPSAIFSSSGETLEQVVVRLLVETGGTVAVAESCTGGFLSHRLTNVPGASAVFLAGYISYSNAAKTASLGVDPKLIAAHGAVSEAVARAMASGALRKADARFALATTGIAGPAGGTPEKRVGTVFIGLAAHDGEAEVLHRVFQSDRETFKQLASQAALDLLRQRLLRSARTE
ncbi:MAG: competence/damage-inducible protein A [Chthoniobacterales bacterium]